MTIKIESIIDDMLSGIKISPNESTLYVQQRTLLSIAEQLERIATALENSQDERGTFQVYTKPGN